MAPIGQKQTRMFPRRVACFVTLTAICLAPAMARAQGAVVRGHVRDAAGEDVADARVIAMHIQTRRTTEGETNGSGRFAFIGLQRGQWVFLVQKPGYEPNQGVTQIGSIGRVDLHFEMSVDQFNPPAPESGVLAGVRATELQGDLDGAHDLFDEGDYEGAVAAYQGILERIPQLTSLNLQIGHAYVEMREYGRARTAYEAVPADTPAAEEAASAIRALDAATPQPR